MAPRKKEQRSPLGGRKSGGWLRAASWFFALALGAALVWAVLDLSNPDANSRGAAVHVTQRYVERGPLETGLSHPAAAVFLDYRSFDLLGLDLLFFLAAILGLLPRLAEGHPPYLSMTARISLLFSFLGLILGLGLGAFCLHGGSNFLDTEPLTVFCKPARAREMGDWILGAAALLASFGAVLAFQDNRRAWEGGKHGR